MSSGQDRGWAREGQGQEESEQTEKQLTTEAQRTQRNAQKEAGVKTGNNGIHSRIVVLSVYFSVSSVPLWLAVFRPVASFCVDPNDSSRGRPSSMPVALARCLESLDIGAFRRGAANLSGARLCRERSPTRQRGRTLPNLRRASFPRSRVGLRSPSLAWKISQRLPSRNFCHTLQSLRPIFLCSFLLPICYNRGMLGDGNEFRPSTRTRPANRDYTPDRASNRLPWLT